MININKVMNKQGFIDFLNYKISLNNKKTIISENSSFYPFLVSLALGINIIFFIITLSLLGFIFYYGINTIFSLLLFGYDSLTSSSKEIISDNLDSFIINFIKMVGSFLLFMIINFLIELNFKIIPNNSQNKLIERLNTEKVSIEDVKLLADFLDKSVIDMFLIAEAEDKPLKWDVLTNIYLKLNESLDLNKDKTKEMKLQKLKNFVFDK